MRFSGEPLQRPWPLVYKFPIGRQPVSLWHWWPVCDTSVLHIFFSWNPDLKIPGRFFPGLPQTVKSWVGLFFQVCYNRDPGFEAFSRIIPTGIGNPAGIPDKFRRDPGHILGSLLFWDIFSEHKRLALDSNFLSRGLPAGLSGFDFGRGEVFHARGKASSLVLKCTTNLSIFKNEHFFQGGLLFCIRISLHGKNYWIMDTIQSFHFFSCENL